MPVFISSSQPAPTLDAVNLVIGKLQAEVKSLSDQQSQINADVAAIQADIAALQTAVTNINDALAAAKAANPAVDLSALDTAVTDLNTATQGVSSIAPPPATPPTTP